jgi:hypothetical protein
VVLVRVLLLCAVSVVWEVAGLVMLGDVGGVGVRLRACDRELEPSQPDGGGDGDWFAMFL